MWNSIAFLVERRDVYPENFLICEMQTNAIEYKQSRRFTNLSEL